MMKKDRVAEPKDTGSKAPSPDNATLCQQGLMPKTCMLWLAGDCWIISPYADKPIPSPREDEVKAWVLKKLKGHKED